MNLLETLASLSLTFSISIEILKWSQIWSLVFFPDLTAWVIAVRLRSWGGNSGNPERWAIVAL